MSLQALPAQAKELFHYLFEQASLGIALEDLDGKLLLANPALCSMLGYTNDELCSMSCSEFASHEDSQDDWALFHKLREGVLDHYALEKRYVRKDGAHLWGRLNVSLLKDLDGGSPLVFALVEDITERRRTGEALQQSEERFQLAVQAGKMFAYEWDAATDRMVRSGDCEDILGIDKWGLVGTGHQVLAKVHPEDRGKLLAADGALTPEKPNLQVSHRMLRPDGSVIWVERTGRAHFDEQGKMLRIVGMVADITERERAEEALRQSESNYRMFVSQSAEGIFCQELVRPIPVDLPEADQVQRILHESYLAECNDSMARMYGLSPADFVGKRLTETVDPLNAINIELTRDYIRNGYRVVDRESHEVDPQGNPKVFLNSMIGFVEDGLLLRTWGIQRDITDRRQAEQARLLAEQALRDNEQRLRLAVQAGKMYAYEWDVATDKIVRSEEYVNVLGYRDRAEGLTRQQLLDSIHAEDRALFASSFNHLTPENPTTQISYRALRPDGSLIWLEKSARGFFDEQGKLLRMIGMVTDITDRKLSEAALANASRRLIEAQEQERTRIARELHDDLGQSLALLAVELDQIQQDLSALPEVRSRVGELQKRTVDLATDVQSLSHELHSARLELVGIAAAMRGFCQAFGAKQRVEVDFQSRNLPLPMSRETSLCFYRVLQEALHNSAKHSGVRRVQVRFWGDADEIHLTVKDSGSGFDLEAAKDGQGLGLISMEERLKLLNGTLGIDSQPQRGTTIHARAPLPSESAPLRAAG
ncbi:MAG TPA: PAS domain S-box protein [Candidatus Sulfotelmatobacter sp.]